MNRHTKYILNKITTNWEYSLNVDLPVLSRSFQKETLLSITKGRIKKKINDSSPEYEDKYSLCFALVFCGRSMVRDGRFEPVLSAKQVTLWRYEHDEHYRKAFKRILDRTLNRSEYNVYFMRRIDRGFIKIGVSRNIKRRCEALKKEIGCDINVIGVLPGVSFNIENMLHRKFDHLNVELEWFRPDDELLNFIALNADTTGDCFYESRRNKLLGTTNVCIYNHKTERVEEEIYFGNRIVAIKAREEW